MKKRNLLLLAAFAIFLSMSNLQAQQYTLSDNDVVVVNGVIQSCSYTFEIKEIIIPEVLDGQSVLGIKDASWTGEGIFQEKGITDIQLPATIELLGRRAFNLNELSTLDLSLCPKINTIGAEAFKRNNILTLNLNNCTELTIIDHNAFLENSINLLDFSGCSSLQIIGEQAFSDNNIQSINFSNCENLEIIDYAAFFFNHIAELDFGDCINLRTIGYEAFFLNGNLTNIQLSGCKSLLEIGWWAFSNTSLTGVDLSPCTSLVTLGIGAFDDTQVSHIILPTPDYPGFEFWKSTEGNIFYAGDTVSKVNGYNAKDVYTPVTFVVTNNGSPIDSATIDFYKGPYMTNENGTLALANVLQGNYPYMVSADGFVDVEGELPVGIDSISLTIEMSGVFVEEFYESAVSVYPNPGKNMINFELPGDFTGGRVELYNNNGKLVIGKYIQGNLKSISTEKLPQGIYLVRVFNNDKMLYSGKWVKE